MGISAYARFPVEVQSWTKRSELLARATAPSGPRYIVRVNSPGVSRRTRQYWRWAWIPWTKRWQVNRPWVLTVRSVSRDAEGPVVHREQGTSRPAALRRQNEIVTAIAHGGITAIAPRPGPGSPTDH